MVKTRNKYKAIINKDLRNPSKLACFLEGVWRHYFDADISDEAINSKFNQCCVKKIWPLIKRL